MTEEYRVGKISNDQPEPGFTNMHRFLLNRSTGMYGAMLGNSALDLPLPTPVFLDALQTGLQGEDAKALSFYFGEVANFLQADSIAVCFDRFDYPSAEIQGKAYPDTKVFMGMSFLKSRDMVWSNEVASAKLLLPAYIDWHLKKLLPEGSGVKVDGYNRFYVEMLDWPDVVAQIERYPDLAEAVRAYKESDEDPIIIAFKEAAKVLGEDWTAYTRPKMAKRQQDEVMKRYGAYYFRVRDSLVVDSPTLNEVVDDLKANIPSVQEAYSAAKDKFVLKA